MRTIKQGKIQCGLTFAKDIAIVKVKLNILGLGERFILRGYYNARHTVIGSRLITKKEEN